MPGDPTSVALPVLIAQAGSFLVRVRRDAAARVYLAEAFVDPAALEERLVRHLAGAWEQATAPERAAAWVRSLRAKSKEWVDACKSWRKLTRETVRAVHRRDDLAPSARLALEEARALLPEGTQAFPTWRRSVRLVLVEIEPFDGAVDPLLTRVVVETRALLASMDAHEEARRAAADAEGRAGGETDDFREAMRVVVRRTIAEWAVAVAVSRGKLAPLNLQILESARAQARRRRKAKDAGEPPSEATPRDGAAPDETPTHAYALDDA